MASQYAGQMFKLFHHRMRFVEAYDDSGGVLVSPRIIDKKGGPQDVANYKQYLLNDTGAFIVRLVLQEVDSELIAGAFDMAYNPPNQSNLGAARIMVDNFITHLLNYNPKLLRRTNRSPLLPHAPPNITTVQPFTGLVLDFGINLNQTGPGGYKIPPR